MDKLQFQFQTPFNNSNASTRRLSPNPRGRHSVPPICERLSNSFSRRVQCCPALRASWFQKSMLPPVALLYDIFSAALDQRER
jgi:hypothetical protein